MASEDQKLTHESVSILVPDASSSINKLLLYLHISNSKPILKLIKNHIFNSNLIIKILRHTLTHSPTHYTITPYHRRMPLLFITLRKMNRTKFKFLVFVSSVFPFVIGIVFFMLIWLVIIRFTIFKYFIL